MELSIRRSGFSSGGNSVDRSETNRPALATRTAFGNSADEIKSTGVKWPLGGFH